MANTEAKKSNKMLFLAAGLLVLGAAGGAGWFLLRPAGAAAEAAGKEESHKIQATLSLESFVVNLADSNTNSFLRVGIDLGLTRPMEAGGHGESAPDFTGPVRDTIVEILSARESAALLSAEGKTQLKRDLLSALQERVPELHVGEVYFTEFLVQR
ncbi:MAG TPA: flagellar basal body-associated FliL family protein [Terriglobia bacterium]|nr:flagellar basal body-associated FliL family protein [Terriglobia bacterium]